MYEAREHTAALGDWNLKVKKPPFCRTRNMCSSVYRWMSSFRMRRLRAHGGRKFGIIVVGILSFVLSSLFLSLLLFEGLLLLVPVLVFFLLL